MFLSVCTEAGCWHFNLIEALRRSNRSSPLCLWGELLHTPRLAPQPSASATSHASPPALHSPLGAEQKTPGNQSLMTSRALAADSWITSSGNGAAYIPEQILSRPPWPDLSSWHQAIGTAPWIQLSVSPPPSILLIEARQGSGALGKKHLEAVFSAQSPLCWRRKAWERQRECLSFVSARQLKGLQWKMTLYTKREGNMQTMTSFFLGTEIGGAFSENVHRHIHTWTHIQTYYSAQSKSRGKWKTDSPIHSFNNLSVHPSVHPSIHPSIQSLVYSNINSVPTMGHKLCWKKQQWS